MKQVKKNINPKIKSLCKQASEVSRMTINGEDYFDVADLNNATLYASPYLVVNRQEYTKHIYAGSKRIVSKLAVGLESSIVNPFEYVHEGEEGIEFGQIGDNLRDYLIENLSCAEVDYRNVNYNMNFEFFEEHYFIPAEEEEHDIYFYHTDHLGSSSWITYTDGSVTQYMQNLPFGEPFIDQRTTEYDIRYKFTGKEMDTETGYQYFGARYYNSDISIWLSVDPLASDFPNISPYNYVEQNPVKYIDEEGENPIGALIGAAVGAVKEIGSQTISNGFTNLQNGEGFFKGWSDNMDWADVGISTAEGALAGLTMGASLGVTLAIEAGAAVARSSIDWKGNDKTPNVIFGQGDYKKDWAEFGYDIAGEAFSMGLRYGSGLNKVDFYGKNGSDFSGAFWKTFTEGTFDGIWKTPTSIYKDAYKRGKEFEKDEAPIFGGNLPPVEIYPPSHEKASQNSSIVRKKYEPWLQK
jgi:RHS repeat-associated protein